MTVIFSFSFVEATAVPEAAANVRSTEEVDGLGLERRRGLEEAAGEAENWDEGVSGRFVGIVAGDLRGRDGEIVDDLCDLEADIVGLRVRGMVQEKRQYCERCERGQGARSPKSMESRHISICFFFPTPSKKTIIY